MECDSLACLPPTVASSFGDVLTKAVSAIEMVTNADRVYLLSFCEIDRRLHFHLFPRTEWLLEAYQFTTETENGPVNGPMLFEWARQQYKNQIDLPSDIPGIQETVMKLRDLLQG